MPGPSKKRTPADAQPKPRQGLDIRTLFQRAEIRYREIKGEQNKDNSVVIIHAFLISNAFFQLSFSAA